MEAFLLSDWIAIGFYRTGGGQWRHRPRLNARVPILTKLMRHRWQAYKKAMRLEVKLPEC
jgi:hypothetical protein